MDFGTTIGNALSNALNLIVTFLPRVVGFLVIILVGWLIAYLVSRALTFLLRKLHFDNLANRIGITRFEQRMGVRMDAAGILGTIVFWFIFLIFLVPAADALGLPAVSNVLNALVDYIPNVFVAILVLFLGALAGTAVADLVRGATASANVGNPNIFAGIARWAIIGFAGLIALEQLQIAPALLNILFTALVGGLALAFGLAFGLGGQDAARKWLARGEASATDAAVRISQAQQSNNDLARAEQYRAQQLQAQQLQAQQLQAQQLQAQQTQTQPGYPQQQQPFTAPDQMNRPTQQ
ncbi:MAG: small-conductance mechanosensitive ion channel [Ktedonobacteraceae bacterium]